MKTNRYTMMFALAAACSTVHAQDAFRDLAFIEATDAPAVDMPATTGLFNEPVSTTSAAAATNLVAPTPKDFQTAPVAHTLIKGGGESSRPTYEGRSSRRSAPAPVTTSAKGGTVEPAPYEEGDTATDLHFSLEAGYHSRYYYHGLDQIGNSSADLDSTGVMMFGVSATWKGLFLGYKYALATEDTTARFLPGVDENYSEHILEAGYTLGILPKGWLDMTASYQYIAFGDQAFWGNDAQNRFMLKAEVNRFQWFRPSVAYYKFEGVGESNAPAVKGSGILDGEQLVFQIQGGGQIYEYGPVAIGFSYYVLAGLDNEYNGGGNDFGEVDHVQAGISLPIIYQNFTVAPSVHYCDGKNGNTTNDEIWAGVNVTYSF